MSAPTPPPSSRDSPVTRMYSTPSSPTHDLFSEVVAGMSEPTQPYNSNITAAETSPRLKEEDDKTPSPSPHDADIEMSDASGVHEESEKEEALTSGRQRTGSSSVEIKTEATSEVKREIKTGAMSEVKCEVKTKVESQIKSEFELEAPALSVSHLTEPAQKSNENESGAEKPKQPRRAPVKNPLEYHKRQQEDSAGGIRKVRKIFRHTNPEELLHSIGQDPVSAYNAGPSSGEAPIMQVSTKKDFMREMLSKFPKEDFQKFKTELGILDEESRSFGFRRMEMKNG